MSPAGRHPTLRGLHTISWPVAMHACCDAPQALGWQVCMCAGSQSLAAQNWLKCLLPVGAAHTISAGRFSVPPLLPTGRARLESREGVGAMAERLSPIRSSAEQGRAG